MKRLIQLTLLLFLVLVTLNFYNNYFKEKKFVTKEIQKEINIDENSNNNVIKNLEYRVILDQNTEYIIKSNHNELIYKDNFEIVKMKKVLANIIGKKNNPIIISSDDANYSNSTYETTFFNNVKIKYMNEIIYANKIHIDFKNKLIKISEDVIYDGLNQILKADIVNINMVTNKIEIIMENQKDKIKIFTK